MRMPRPLVPSLVLAFDLGCSTVASNDDDAGVTTNQSSDDGSTGDDDDGSTGSTGSMTTTSTTDDGAQTDADTDPAEDGIKLDVPQPVDFGPPADCSTAWLSWDQVAAVYPDCMLEPGDNGTCWTEPMIGCMPPGPDGCTCPEGNCIENWGDCSGDDPGWSEAVPEGICGPYVIDGLCCSIGEFTTGCAE